MMKAPLPVAAVLPHPNSCTSGLRLAMTTKSNTKTAPSSASEESALLSQSVLPPSPRRQSPSRSLASWEPYRRTCCHTACRFLIPRKTGFRCRPPANSSARSPTATRCWSTLRSEETKTLARTALSKKRIPPSPLRWPWLPFLRPATSRLFTCKLYQVLRRRIFGLLMGGHRNSLYSLFIVVACLFVIAASPQLLTTNLFINLPTPVNVNLIQTTSTFTLTNNNRLGMIKSYCHQDVERGILLLKKASSDGYVRSSYALGLVLRDSKPMEASQYMKLAAGEGYLPALQELLPAREMKAKYGEPNADELRRHLDPICLNRLLGRHYVHSAELRELNTSHCWNPLCGRWAFKASVSSSSAATAGRIRRPWGYSIFRNGNGGGEAAAPAPVAGTAHHHHHHNHNDNTNAETRVDSSGTSDESSSSQSSISQNSDGSSTSTASCVDIRVSRMKMCSRCCRAKYCSKLCQVYDWRSSRHKMECQFL